MLRKACVSVWIFSLENSGLYSLNSKGPHLGWLSCEKTKHPELKARFLETIRSPFSGRKTSKGSFVLTGDLPRAVASLVKRWALKSGTTVGSFLTFIHSFQKRTLLNI